MNIADQLQENHVLLESLRVEQLHLIGKAFQSNDDIALIKAQSMWSNYQKTDQKAVLTDPFNFSNAMGYKHTRKAMSFDMLRKMGNNQIVSAIIGARTDQIAEFCQPQQHRTDIGFEIRKKKRITDPSTFQKTKRDDYIIEDLTNFLLNCGTDNNKWHGDNFEDFLRKFTIDSLTLDQGTFETIYDSTGYPTEFIATDGATMRVSDTIDENDQYNRENVNRTNRVKKHGYLPSYCQVVDEQIVAEFYPWELCFGVRNPNSSIKSFGYGRSELEILVSTVTGMINADAYNGKFFTQGSAPKGLLKINENVTDSRLAEFRQQWMSQMMGLNGAHRVPVIRASEMEWINLATSNKDSEFSKWQEYLISITCAVYKMDPTEIGMRSGGGSDNKPIFESNNAARLKYSRDKGLRPILRFIQNKLNKYIIGPLTKGEFEFVFCGLDVQDEKDEIDMDIRKVGSFLSLKEVRRKYGLPDEIDDDDLILNSIWFQNKMSVQQQGGGEGQPASEEDRQGQDEEENPLMKAFLDKLNSGDFMK